MASAAKSSGPVETVTTAPDGHKLRRTYHTHRFSKYEFCVDSRYVNLRPIGKGAYGLVCSAEDKLTGRKVAIKRVGNVFQDLIDAKRILREIKLLRHLGRHENVVELMDLMTGPPETQNFKHLYLVTQLYECDLERIVTSSQRLTDSHAQYFIYQVLRGLKYIHSANVLHRDLKPPNVLVNSNCDLAICDFGLSRGISEEVEMKLTEYVVTRWYRAPELLCECETYGPAVDVWSTGCIMGEILARRPLFQGSSTRAQLELIIRLLGSPSDEVLEAVASPAAARIIRNMPKYPRADFAAVFPGVNPQGLDLLSRMLVFDYRKRLSVDDALKHPYLEELHSRADEPTCSTFDFTFEKDYPDEMPRELLQKHMFSEMLTLQEEEAKAAAAAAEVAASASAGAGGKK
mmetsp:Transcript_76577/g.155441  ORF Transcript_76577/g.155441 Transcript_76577/m.155441 type:complete len:403 (+) Transcript_76577:105-1313(+)